MKSKAAIISLNMHTYVLNYGSVLQSYALQQYLKKIGKDSVIVDYVPFHAIGYYKPISRLFRNKNFLKIKSFTKAHLSNFYFLIKYRKFDKFFAKNYNTTSHTYLHDEILSAQSIDDLDIDTFICGSDTVWKLDQMKCFNKVLYLDFPATMGKCKISYAPSMGSKEFTKEESLEFTRLISDFKAISVREQTCADYIQQFAKQNVIRVVDPTLLLNEEDYASITADVKERGYVLLYSCEEYDAEMEAEAKRLAINKGLKLIEITTMRNVRLIADHKIIYTAGVEDFLGYLKHADYVVCNSFHGMCFSIIFKRNVFLFERNKTDYKMPDLVKMLGIEDCMVPCENKRIVNLDAKIDYQKAYISLEKVRNTSYKYLKENVI